MVVKGGRSGPGGGRWSGGQTERRPTRWLRGAAGFLRWALPWTWGRTGEDLVLRRCRRPVRACRRGLGPWRSSRAGRARGGPHLCGGSLSVPTVPVPRLLSRPLAQLSVRAESKAAPGPAHVPGRRGPRAPCTSPGLCAPGGCPLLSGHLPRILGQPFPAAAFLYRPLCSLWQLRRNSAGLPCESAPLRGSSGGAECGVRWEAQSLPGAAVRLGLCGEEGGGGGPPSCPLEKPGLSPEEQASLLGLAASIIIPLYRYSVIGS